ncbi:MAG: ABC transporter permease [Bacteroidetes bacterium]|nr:ABC transporter permease [Bacteroidota bacterium]
MLRHFFQIAWRNLKKRKLFGVINITGLSIGMACCLLITLYVQNELSYDRYHAKADRIYRVTQTFRHVEKGENPGPPSPQDYSVWGCAPLAPALQADFPEIEKIVRFMSPSSLLLQYGDKRIQQENIVCMDSSAFDVFSWKMIYGDPHTALVAPNSIVLTRSVSEKFFGKADPVGKVFRVDNQVDLNVTGVMEDVPANSQFTFNGLISMSSMRKWRAEIFNWWGYVDFYTYLVLKKNARIESLQAKAADFVKRNNPDDRGYAINFEKMTDAYLHSVAVRQPGATGSLTNVYLFSCIAVFIVLIACINFMNLSTARSLERAKEVGVRKVLGVTPASLVRQFLAESILLSLFAGVIAFVLAGAALPLVGKLSGKDLGDINIFRLPFILAMVGCSIVVGIIAGIYPAWFLSGFKAITVLKGKFNPSGKGISLRKALVVFQFTVSIVLIAGTITVFQQLSFVSNHSLGFHKEQMLIVNFEGDAEVENHIETIKSAIAKAPGVLSVAASRAVPGEFLPNAGTQIEMPDGKMGSQGPLIYEIDFDFLPTYHIPLLAGRNYSRAFQTDSAESMIINEAAARLYGYRNPADAVGKRFDQWGRKGKIIGVVKDFNFQSLHQDIQPLTLRYGYPNTLNRISVQMKGDNVTAAIAQIGAAWNRLAPQRPFLYHFLDQSFNDQYQADQKFGNLFSLFSCLSIFIACLGLFGLSTFMAQQRIKEIGIRKVLGSSQTSIVMLLSKDFVILIFVAMAISVPLCWWVMSDWLKGFAYRVEMGPVVFVEAGAIALVIALATMTWQSLRAAMANPVRSLRSE